MEIYAKPKQATPQLEFNEPTQVHRPRFPQSLLEDEDKFVDPKAEATLMLPENSMAFMPIQIALEASARPTEQTVRAGVFKSVYELLSSWFAAIKARLGKRGRARTRLTKEGKRALEQLKHLSLVCDATDHRSPEEILTSEAAFGEAYYEILNLSSNLEKMAQKEETHHMHRYSRHMASLLRSSP